MIVLISTLYSDSHVAMLSLLMPVYFIKDDLTRVEVDIARESWKLILGCPIQGELNPYFITCNIKETLGHQSTVSWFFDTFYKRFFDVHPCARPLFTGGLKTQGRFMVKMITLLLSNLEDNSKFTEALVKLAEVHNQRGIKAIEYGVVGEILFYTLRTVLGPVAYDKTVHRAWVMVFSSMLKTLIPIAVQYEMTTGSKYQETRDYVSDDARSMDFSTNNSSRDGASVTNPTGAISAAPSNDRATTGECPFK